MKHLFWLVFFLLVIAWYLVVTIIVGWRGWSNIRTMLDSVKDNEKDQE